MKKLFFLIFIVSACSTVPEKAFRKTANEGSKTADDYSWVDQLNFDKKIEAKYQSDKDEFNVQSDESSHALVRESLYGLHPARLEEAVAKTADAITKINIKCYQNKFEEGFKIADEVYDKYKNNTSYWNQLGTCYFLKSDYAKAILFYNKSRDLDAKFTPPINNLGVVYVKQGKYQKALAAFKKASAMSTFSVTPVYNLASLYLRFGTVGKALPIFLGLQKKSPQDVELNSAVAAANLLKGDYEAAIKLYATMDKDILARPNVGLNYAVALKLTNRPIDAQTVYNNVVESGSAEVKAYARRVENFIRK